MRRKRRYNPIFGNYFNPGGDLNKALTWEAFKENVGNAPIDKQMGAAVGGAGMLAKTTGIIVGNLTMPEAEEQDVSAKSKWELSREARNFQGYDIGRADYDYNLLGDTAEGAMTGMSVGGPAGALIGGAVGLGSNIFKNISAGIGNRMRAKKEEELNQLHINKLNLQNSIINKEEADRFLTTQLAYGGILPSTKNVAAQLSRYNNNIFADGGYIPNQYAYGGQFSNGVTSFNTGGTHEENPYGGIMQGIGENGEPNFVEEGEVKWRDYIFSDRLKVPKEVDEFLLPKAIVNKTYADAAEYLQKESKERELDKISKLGLTTSLTKLMIAQEQQKAIEEEGEPNMFRNGGAFNQPFPENMNWLYKTSQRVGQPNMFGDGGGLMSVKDRFSGLPFADITAITDVLVREGSVSQKIQNLKQLGFPVTNEEFGTLSKFVNDWQEGIEESNRETAPAPAPPQVPTMTTTETRSTQRTSPQQPQSTVSPESPVEAPKKTEEKPKEEPVESTSKEPDKEEKPAKVTPDEESPATGIEGEDADTGTENPEDTTPENPWQRVANDALRYAPIMANIANLTSLMASKPDRIKLDRIYTPFLSDRMDYNPIDSNYMANQMAQQAASTNRHLIDSAGGNRAIAQAALLSANRGSQGAIGDAMLSVNQANEEKLRFAKEFNKNVNQFNIQNNLQTQQYNAAAHQQELMWAKQSEAARRTAINQGITALGTGIGDIATESRWMGIAPKMGQGYYANADYNTPLGSFRDYMNKAKKERAKRKAAQTPAEGSTKRFGGIIYKRKIK